MRQYRLLVMLLVAGLLAAMCCSVCSAGSTFPFPNIMFGSTDGLGDALAEFRLQQGWFAGDVAWFIQVQGFALERHFLRDYLNTDLNYQLRYAKLGSAIGAGSNMMYVVLNYQQGPVFAAMPGDSGYSGLWQVVYITWKRGVTKRPIISALDLPTTSEADYNETNIVVDRPIMAIGKLGGPWQPAPEGSYRCPQVWDYDVRDKVVLLPGWFVYGQREKTRQVTISLVIIPDVADPDLARLLRANYAPGLADVDAENTQSLWVQDWTKQPAPPPFQFPITEQIDNFASNLMAPDVEHNPAFSPVMDFTLLERDTLPASTIVNNPTTLGIYLPPTGTGFLPVGSPVRVNAPIYGSIPLYVFLRLITDGT